MHTATHGKSIRAWSATGNMSPEHKGEHTAWAEGPTTCPRIHGRTQPCYREGTKAEAHTWRWSQRPPALPRAAAFQVRLGKRKEKLDSRRQDTLLARRAGFHQCSTRLQVPIKPAPHAIKAPCTRRKRRIVDKVKKSASMINARPFAMQRSASCAATQRPATPLAQQEP